MFKTNDTYLDNSKYFIKLHNHLNREDVSRAFYEYLSKLDISQIENFQNIRPKTEYYNEMIRLNLSPFYRYLAHLTSHSKIIDIENSFNYDPEEYYCKTALSLYKRYIDWCDDRNFSKEFKYTNTKFGLEIKKVIGMSEDTIVKKHLNSASIYVINKEKLKQLLVTKIGKW